MNQLIVATDKEAHYRNQGADAKKADAMMA